MRPSRSLTPLNWTNIGCSLVKKVIRSVWLWLSVRRVVRRWSGWSDVWTQRSRSWPSQPEEPWGRPWLPPSLRNDRSLAAHLPLCRRSSLRTVLQWCKFILSVLRIQASTLEADGDVRRRRDGLMTHNKHSNLVLMNQYNGQTHALWCDDGRGTYAKPFSSVTRDSYGQRAQMLDTSPALIHLKTV